jgi:YidC/Oxa1 family membrane protein insertase
MDRRMIIAVLVSVVLVIAYQYFFMPKPEEPKKPVAPQTAEAPKVESKKEAAVTVAPLPQASSKHTSFTATAQLKPPPREVTVETPLYTATLSNQGATLKSFKLKKYTEKGEVRDLWIIIKEEFFPEKKKPAAAAPKKGDPVELVLAKSGAPGALQLTRQEADDPLARDYYQIKGDNLSLKEKEKGQIAFTYVSPEGLKVTKTYSFNADSYLMEMEIQSENLSRAGQKSTLSLLYGPGFRAPIKEKQSDGYREPALMVNGKKTEEKLSKLTGIKTFEGKVQWIALQDSYFLAALLPRDGETKAVFLNKDAGGEPLMGINFGEVALTPGRPRSFKAAIFMGPKEDALLKKVGPELATIIDYGWFDFLARPFLWLMTFLYTYVKNYGLAIILVSVLIKIILYPLTQKQMKSMKAMQELQPKLKALQEKHKGDKQKLNQETFELYKRHGVNPFGGCLPLLLQFPVFIAIYQALSNAIELRQAPFFLWIDDLAAKDPYYILPVFMGVSMFIQQKLTPSSPDPKQAQMMNIMNIVFIFLFLNFPSGLVLYYLVFNLLSLAQQKFMGTPSPTGVPGTAS